MRRIVVGYGEFEGHSLPEVSLSALQELSRRYPLEAAKYDSSSGRRLLIAVAIHEEIRRRENGGKQEKKIPTSKELALELVRTGFRQLSKTHHPDRDGSADTQRRLNEMRDWLLNACSQIKEESEHLLVIESVEQEIADEDIPF